MLKPASFLPRAAAACLLLWLGSAVGAADAGDAWTEAITARDVAALARMTAQDSDVNRGDESGHTALMVASGQGNPRLVRELLERGAEVNAANRRGGTALMYAAAAGDLTAVRLLLGHGAAIDARASNGWTPLMLACARGFESVVHHLLAHGADPNSADIYGWTPLMRAIDLARPQIARALLGAARTDPDLRNENGHTALHLAAARGAAPLVRLLLARGADALTRDDRGRTPAAVARLQGHEAVAEILKRVR